MMHCKLALLPVELSEKEHGLLRAVRRYLFRCTFLLVLALAGGVGYWRWGRSPTRGTEVVVEETTIDGPTEQRIIAFCGNCHAMPPPGSFPRDAWHHEVMQGYQFYAKSGRSDLDPPPPHLAIAYFRARSPVALELPSPARDAGKFADAFRVQPLERDPDLAVPPAVAHLRWTQWEGNRHVLLACDMRLGEISVLDVKPEATRRTQLVRLNNPCHVEPCDLDVDSRYELLVADLGSFDPDDHDRGRIVWLHGSSPQDLEVVPLVTGLGRVADVRPVDFDGDGRQDLAVAEFGWHDTGSVRVLRRAAADAGGLQFTAQVLEPLPGAIHVPAHDFNADGWPDLVALISQEHERVVVFENEQAQFHHKHIAWAAPDPGFGSSGIELTDLDQDGDQDILYTNGDTFDSMYVKPSHGVQWLENQGNWQFTHHRLVDLPGAYRALPGDMDGDGDLDVVVSIWLPRQMMSAAGAADEVASLVLLEQTERGRFEPRTLEKGNPYYATMELADFDQDGDPDIAVAGHLANLEQSARWGAIWWNELP